MIIANKRIKDLLPAHYREYAPRFITFLEKYYDWLHRSSGMSDGEVNDLRNDTSWLEKDIDKFISTGQLRYLDPNNPEILEANLVELNNTENPGMQSEKLSDKFLLDEDLGGYLTSEGDEFADSEDLTVELQTVENKILDSWFSSMGIDRIKRKRIDALNNLDQVLMLSLLKHIYAIKGTEASIKLFFNMFFNEEVVIYQPKLDVAIIDERMVLDGNEVLRDDETFQEYSYVIVVSKDLLTYKDVFNSIYMKTIHPSGFRVAITKSDTFVPGVPLKVGGYIIAQNDVYIAPKVI